MGKHDIQNFDVNIINQEYQGGHEWLGNETNAKISDGQALKQQFCRRMNRSHFTKSNQDQNVAQKCRDGETIFTAAIAMYKPTRTFAESSVFITVTFPPSVKFTTFLAVIERRGALL